MFYFIKNFILLFTLIKCQPCIATNVQIKDNEVQHSHYENETFFQKIFYRSFNYLNCKSYTFFQI